MSSKPITFRLRLANLDDEARKVILEPWTGEYTIGSHGDLEVEVTGTPGTPLLIELQGSEITISAFDTPGAELKAFRGGTELKSE